MENETLGFIGAGNMASSLIRGLIAKGINPKSILVADIDSEKLHNLSSESGIQASDNQEIAESADVIVLAVKPQVMKDVCSNIKVGDHSPLVVSVAAGISIEHIESWLGSDTAVTRCMPNTPALVGKGASGLFANSKTTDEQRSLAANLMEAVGISVWVEKEEAIDTVTALSGSGPAYFFLFIEAMQEAAKELGLAEDIAKRLSIQTALGAAELALQSAEDVAELRRQVTSPGGTTEQALNVFESEDLRSLVSKALKAAHDRSAELANEFGDT